MFVDNRIENCEIPVSLSLLESIADVMLPEFDEEGAEFTLAFVLPEEIRELNKTYRETDAVTDVLSFESGGEVDPETGKDYLGDIIICLARAEEQAKLSGHSVENEIRLLEIHGILHLLGYDHDTEENKAEMWQLQQEYLDRCGVKLNRKPGEDFDF